MSYMRLVCLLIPMLTAISAASGQPQPQPTMDLYIELEQALCKTPVHEVWIVTNGRDQAFEAKQLSRCTWVRREIPTVNVDIAYFSARLGSAGRTRCRRAVPIGNREIKVTFTARGETPSHDLKISGAHVDYVREVAAVERDDVRCIEEGTVPKPVSNLQRDVEDLRLQIFPKKLVRCGVILDNLDLLIKAKGGDELDVTREHLAWGVEKQDLKGKSCYAPTFSPLEAIENNLPKEKPVFRIEVH